MALALGKSTEVVQPVTRIRPVLSTFIPAFKVPTMRFSSSLPPRKVTYSEAPLSKILTLSRKTPNPIEPVCSNESLALVADVTVMWRAIMTRDGGKLRLAVVKVSEKRLGSSTVKLLVDELPPGMKRSNLTRYVPGCTWRAVFDSIAAA